MDPVTGSLALQAASAGASGLSGFGAAQGEKEQAEINAFIGRTRAIQTSTDAMQGLNSELATMRNALGANAQAPGVGTFEVMQELRETRDRERRIKVGNRNAEAAGHRMQAKAAGHKATGALIGGALKAGPSLFDLYDYKRTG